MSTLWGRVARAMVGEDYASAYAERFRLMAERGDDVHGEATFVTGLVDPPARVLDAGCGTGRIAARLATLGYDVVACDVDATMIEVARRDAPTLDWRVADLACLDLGVTFDVVLLAGNVIPFLEGGTLEAAALRLAAHVAPGGVLIAGYGLDAAHLPTGAPVVPIADVDAAMVAAGLVTTGRWSTWDRQHYEGGGYVVGAWGRA